MNTVNFLICLAIFSIAPASDETGPDESDKQYLLHEFQVQPLTDVYYSEGVNIGEINNDGHIDIVYGPFWFAGPSFEQRYEIYKPLAQPRQKYADHFFCWTHDFDSDGWKDVFVVGFPGTPAFVYRNPGSDGFESHWKKHQVFDWVSNESPQFTNIVGDEKPELICTKEGRFGYATIDWDAPFKTWTFHPISGAVAHPRYGHGLGVGDVDGDGKLDVITKNGWFLQPNSLVGNPAWVFHGYEFSAPGGADMHAYDVDGDGDNDIITSLDAHAYGLAWFENVKDGDKTTFVKHLIMGRSPEESDFGLVFTELHTVRLADMDGDGLKDIVTGKTFWSHHTQSPMWDAGAVVYWFKLSRENDGIRWTPYLAAADTGVGRQVIVGDINDDKSPDIVVGGMKGANAITQQRRSVDIQTWETNQPVRRVSLKSGLPPQQAADHMTTLPGFQLTLSAGEPQIHQPVAFTIDERGRIWVAEAYTYPRRAPDGQGKDKIVILEDTDGNGSLDSRKIFCEGLNLVSGLEVGFGGVWVGAAPYLMFIPDENRDDTPDSDPKILLDGFGFQDTHETLNSFIWGPDGWLYGCHGVFTHSRVGKPGTDDSNRVPLNAAVWRYHPTLHEFEVFCHGTSNPWGVDFNDHGQAFITACVIPHLWHVIQGGRYQRQAGQHFNAHTFDEIRTIADHQHFVGKLEDHAWWGHEPQAPEKVLNVGGGHAHCGAMIYLGDNWPESFRNQIFMNNIHGNRVNQDLLSRKGSGFVGKHGKDVLIANDQWFRGINLKYGPDGSVYLIDWYDKNACHRTNPEIWDRTNGRIYNLAYGQPDPVSVDLNQLTDAKLVELQLHSNDWYVRTSRRILQHRSDKGTLQSQIEPMLLERLDSQVEIPRKLRLLWALNATGMLTTHKSLELLNHEDEFIRSWAIQLELQNRNGTSWEQTEFVSQLAKLAKTDPSPVVRLYLASAASRISPQAAWPILENLSMHGEDSSDHNLPAMYWYAVEPLVANDIDRALKMADLTPIELIRRNIVRRACIAPRGLAVVFERLTHSKDENRQKMYLESVLQSFKGRANLKAPNSWTECFEVLSTSKQPSIRNLANRIALLLGDQRVYPMFRDRLMDRAVKMSERIEALNILVQGRDKAAAKAYQSVLSEKRLRGPAIRALSALDDPSTADSIIQVFDQLDSVEKRDAVATLVSRPSYASELLDAIKQGTISGTEIHAFDARQIQQFDSLELNQKLADVWGTVSTTSADHQQAIARFKDILKPDVLDSANLGNGRRIFDKSCASCHMLYGVGGNVGPDITGSNRANLDYILENMLAPSAVLAKEYRMTVIATLDGRIVSGLIQNETDSAITLRTINDTVVVAKDDIDERKLSELSVMPEGMLDSLKQTDMVDLIAYLRHPAQVAPAGPKAPIDETGHVPNAIEGETMRILGDPPGSVRMQEMGGFAKDRWSDSQHVWWIQGKPGDEINLEFTVPEPGTFDVEVVMTKASDYGIVQLSIDGQRLGGPVDLFNTPDVITTGVLTYPSIQLEEGNAVLNVKLIGANAKAVKRYMFGLDYLRLSPRKTLNTP